MEWFTEAASYAVIGASILGIAVGGFPRLKMNRAGIAFAGASLLIVIGTLSPDEAFGAVHVETLALILSMMIISGSLSLSGFYGRAAEAILRRAGGPDGLLALVIGASGLLSAFFLNDAVCVAMSPFVARLALGAGLNPLPFLVGLATASNVGSAMTLIGNPQNMLIGASSGLPFMPFLLRLAPPVLISLVACYGAVRLAFFKDFGKRALAAGAGLGARVYKPLYVKSLAAMGLMVAGLAVGLPVSLCAMAAASIILVTRRLKPERIFKEIDFTLLVFFAGLFIITAAIGKLPLMAALESSVRAAADSGPFAFAGATAVASNLVSNVPAVMLMRPFIGQGEAGLWELLALSSTFAGNLTLLGSVANLIVAEQAGRLGIRMGFVDYLKAGLPLTLASLAIGTAWLSLA
jgi:Na+/H+ antiporter NhaD/arsenite permease-like protein